VSEKRIYSALKPLCLAKCGPKTFSHSNNFGNVVVVSMSTKGMSLSVTQPPCFRIYCDIFCFFNTTNYISNNFPSLLSIIFFNEQVFLIFSRIASWCAMNINRPIYNIAVYTTFYYIIVFALHISALLGLHQVRILNTKRCYGSSLNVYHVRQFANLRHGSIFEMLRFVIPFLNRL
jgi:hypothetical protein